MSLTALCVCVCACVHVTLVDAWSVAFSPDSKHIATGSHHGKVNIFGVESGKKEYSLDTRGKFILSIAYVRTNLSIYYYYYIFFILILFLFHCYIFYVFFTCGKNLNKLYNVNIQLSTITI